MKHEPSSDLLQFLRSKNILPNGYFSLEEPDGTYTFYSVSRSGVLYTLDLEPAALSADDVWEKLDRIQKISREVFEQAQESLWDARRLARGLPTSRELKPTNQASRKSCVVPDLPPISQPGILALLPVPRSSWAGFSAAWHELYPPGALG